MVVPDHGNYRVWIHALGSSILTNFVEQSKGRIDARLQFKIAAVEVQAQGAKFAPVTNEEKVARLTVASLQKDIPTHGFKAALFRELPFSNRTTKIKLYDKYAERQAKPINDAPPIPVGTFRFEISIPRHQLRLVHLTNLEVLTPKRLEKLLKEKWEVSNYWTNLIWEGEAMDLAHESTLTTARINEVIGFAECLRNSIFMRYSNKEERALKADAKRLGISLGRAITKQGRPLCTSSLYVR